MMMSLAALATRIGLQNSQISEFSRRLSRRGDAAEQRAAAVIRATNDLDAAESFVDALEQRLAERKVLST